MAVSERRASSKSKPEDETTTHKKSDWESIEFVLVVLSLILWWGIYFMMMSSLSQKGDEIIAAESRLPRGLVQGWIPGRYQDLSDHQWRTFRKYIPLLFAGLGLMVFVSNLLKLQLSQWGQLLPWQALPSTQGNGSYSWWTRRLLWLNSSLGLNSGQKLRLLLAGFSSLIMLFYLYRFHALKVLAGALVNYLISVNGRGNSWTPAITWIFNLLFRFSADYYHGFPFASILGPSFAWMDEGAPLSWQTYQNVLMLRQISYNMDFYWMLQNKPVNIDTNKKPNDLRIRTEVALPAQNYNFIGYFAYLFYGPLLIAGPILSYNAFISQIYSPQTEYTVKSIMGLLIRIVLYMLFLEVFLHYVYFNIMNESPMWKHFESYEVAMNALFVLNFMYLKFLIIWRIFRVLALFDGINTIDNMAHCHLMGYTFSSFWRSWHASLNAWIIRYMYIPLGGRKTQKLSIWIIFLFIAIWHDLWFRWIFWALTTVVFFSIELTILSFVNSPNLEWLRRKWFWEIIAWFSRGISGIVIMFSNLALLYDISGSGPFLLKVFFGPEALESGTFIMTLFFASLGALPMAYFIRRESRYGRFLPI